MNEKYCNRDGNQIYTTSKTRLFYNNNGDSISNNKSHRSILNSLRCFVCKNNYSVTVPNATLTHCAVCSKNNIINSTNNTNNNDNNIDFKTKQAAWNDQIKDWSGL